MKRERAMAMKLVGVGGDLRGPAYPGTLGNKPNCRFTYWSRLGGWL